MHHYKNQNVFLYHQINTDMICFTNSFELFHTTVINVIAFSLQSEPLPPVIQH